MGKAGVKHTVCVNHEVGNVSLDDRCRGFKDGLAKNGGATSDVVPASMDPTDTSGRVEAYLTAHPDTDAILALGPAAAAPIMQRLGQMGLIGKIKMGTFDLSPEVLEAIDKGDLHVRHRQPAVPDGLPAGRLLHHEGDVRDAADRRRDDRPGLHHEGRRPQGARALSKQGIR